MGWIVYGDYLGTLVMEKNSYGIAGKWYRNKSMMKKQSENGFFFYNDVGWCIIINKSEKIWICKSEN